MLAPRADEVHIAFERSGRYLRRGDNIRLTGNPTREILGEVTREEGAQFFGIDPGKLTLFVFGGSRGAATINAAMAPLAGSLAGEGIQVLWQTGEEDIEALRRKFGGPGRGVQVFPFIERMECAYAACDLAVCSSGAMSLAELTAEARQVP